MKKKELEATLAKIYIVLIINIKKLPSEVLEELIEASK